jgi:uncharacterized protein
MPNTLIDLLAEKTTLSKPHIANILKMLEEGATIPFIARYRKEMTGAADDETLRALETHYSAAKNLLARKEEISRLIAERAVLSETLKRSIADATSLRALEDLYRPYKEKRNSRAATAIAQGLTPLADRLARADLAIEAFKTHAKGFIKGTVKTVDQAIAGAQDILAERYADDPRWRKALRSHMARTGLLEIKAGKSFDPNGLYKNFAGQSQPIARIPSHRYLAIMRGVGQKELSAKITIDAAEAEAQIARNLIPRSAQSTKALLLEAYKDGLKRLLLPSIEREVHADLKERADAAAIGVFGQNLSQLLMTPPVSKRVLLGVDPAFKTGCKLAVIDENGRFLDSAVINPTAPQKDYEGAKRKILELVKRHHISSVAIGNGTGSQETQAFFARLNEEGANLAYTVVSEAGASVYSASKIASEEYPDLDVTIRGAISIAARVSDPMAALVKIDPKSLGIGQYQHDVDQKLLEKRLHDVTQDLVNRVGVDINTASLSLLSYVAGVGPKVAQNIIAQREANGPFKKKSDLLKVKGLGQKTYEQAAGFIRIKGGNDPLENSGIHPESYAVAKKLLSQDLSQIDVTTQARALGVGEETLKDIITELQKPGFDPREELPAVQFKEGLTDISMLKVGSVVSGVVRNIADFGAFVDIGLKNDGMIHISQMSTRRIAHPLEILALNQHLPQITVIRIDHEKGKVALSLIE